MYCVHYILAFLMATECETGRPKCDKLGDPPTTTGDSLTHIHLHRILLIHPPHSHIHSHTHRFVALFTYLVSAYAPLIIFLHFKASN